MGQYMLFVGCTALLEYQGVTELNDNDNRRSISGKNELCDPEL